MKLIRGFTIAMLVFGFSIASIFFFPLLWKPNEDVLLSKHFSFAGSTNYWLNLTKYEVIHIEIVSDRPVTFKIGKWMTFGKYGETRSYVTEVIEENTPSIDTEYLASDDGFHYFEIHSIEDYAEGTITVKKVS